MPSEGHVQRLVAEAEELQERTAKLQATITKAKAGTLDFELDCPVRLLEEQYEAMHSYLMFLWRRLEIEA